MNFEEIESGKRFVFPNSANAEVFWKVDQFVAESEKRRIGVNKKAVVLEIEKVNATPYQHIDISEWRNSILPPNWQHFGMRVKYLDSAFTIRYQTGSIEHKVYKVRLDSGEWPSDSVLFALVEARMSCEKKWDGSVEKDEKNAVVTIYEGQR